jgi:hypothetical protein
VHLVTACGRATLGTFGWQQIGPVLWLRGIGDRCGWRRRLGFLGGLGRLDGFGYGQPDHCFQDDCDSYQDQNAGPPSASEEQNRQADEPHSALDLAPRL